jgi:hypothetical protein
MHLRNNSVIAVLIKCEKKKSETEEMNCTLAALVSLMMGTNMPMMTAKEMKPLKFKAIAKP